MQKQRGSANSETKPTERRSEDEDYNPITVTKNSITKMQNEEFLIKNACYSPAKYYLCKQNNKRSLLGRKQRSQVVRSFPNRYQFSCTNKVTSLFSDRYIFIIIFDGVFPCGDFCRFLSGFWKVNGYGFGSDIVRTKVHEAAIRARFAPRIFGNEISVAPDVVGNTA